MTKDEILNKAAKEWGYDTFEKAVEAKTLVHYVVRTAMHFVQVACLEKAAENAKMYFQEGEYGEGIYIINKGSITSKDNLI